MVSLLPRYWLALHPRIERPIGAAKQMHRFAEALTASFTRAGSPATQGHPGELYIGHSWDGRVAIRYRCLPDAEIFQGMPALGIA